MRLGLNFRLKPEMDLAIKPVDHPQLKQLPEGDPYMSTTPASPSMGTPPRMTGINVCALQITIAKMEDEGEGEYAGGLRETLANIEAQVSGTHVLVAVSGISEAIEMIENSDTPGDDALKFLRGLLGTPNTKTEPR